MPLKYSRSRTLLFTFTLGLAAVNLLARFDEIPVEVPEVESETPLIIRLCPEPGRAYVDNGYPYFSKEKAMNCQQGGGGA